MIHTLTKRIKDRTTDNNNNNNNKSHYKQGEKRPKSSNR